MKLLQFNGENENATGTAMSVLEVLIHTGVLTPVERCEHRGEKHPNGWVDGHFVNPWQVAVTSEDMLLWCDGAVKGTE